METAQSIASDDIDSKYDDIEYFVSTGLYPAHLKGNSGLKSNLRRQASRFKSKHGALHYCHKPHRDSLEGQLYV